jgi:hypothetical protein
MDEAILERIYHRRNHPAPDKVMPMTISWQEQLDGDHPDAARPADEGEAGAGKSASASYSPPWAPG